MRIRVKDVPDLLAAGVSGKRSKYPDLGAENIKACLQYAEAQADQVVPADVRPSSVPGGRSTGTEAYRTALPITPSPLWAKKQL
jgi:hypothetical protein